MCGIKNSLLALCCALAVGCLLTPEPLEAKDKFLVGFAQDDMSNDWRAAQVREAAKAFGAFPGIDFVHTDAGGKTAKNIRDIEDLVDSGIDLLMVSPRHVDAMTPVIDRVHSQGIPVVLLTRRITTDGYTTIVSPDDRAIARMAAHVLGAALEGKGRVLILQGLPTATTAIARTHAFLEEIASFPGISIAATTPANYRRSDAVKAMENVLAEGIQFDAVYAQSDSMAAGARLAMKTAGIDPKGIPIVGIDYIAEARAAILAGEQAASFTYPTCGAEGAEVAARILRGEKVPRHIEVPSIQVTKDNAALIETVF
jgi:ribose transport system substrate-binding protein